VHHGRDTLLDQLGLILEPRDAREVRLVLFDRVALVVEHRAAGPDPAHGRRGVDEDGHWWHAREHEVTVRITLRREARLGLRLHHRDPAGPVEVRVRLRPSRVRGVWFSV
jgi:hypothetical protein